MKGFILNRSDLLTFDFMKAAQFVSVSPSSAATAGDNTFWIAICSNLFISDAT